MNIIKFSIVTKKNSQSDTFFPKLKNTIVKIEIKSFSVWFGWKVKQKENSFLKSERHFGNSEKECSFLTIVIRDY